MRFVITAASGGFAVENAHLSLAVRRRLSGDRLAVFAAAWSIILLSALPFTPPFSVCTLSTLLVPQVVRGAAAGSSSTTSITTAPTAPLRSAPSVITEERLNDGVAVQVQKLLTLTERPHELVVVAAIDRAEVRPMLTALRL